MRSGDQMQSIAVFRTARKDGNSLPLPAMEFLIFGMHLKETPNFTNPKQNRKQNNKETPQTSAALPPHSAPEALTLPLALQQKWRCSLPDASEAAPWSWKPRLCILRIVRYGLLSALYTVFFFLNKCFIHVVW